MWGRRDLQLGVTNHEGQGPESATWRTANSPLPLLLPPCPRLSAPSVSDPLPLSLTRGHS